MSDEPLLANAHLLRAVARVRAARVHVDYQPARARQRPDPRGHGRRTPLQRVVTVIVDAELPAAATAPAAAADLLFMRAPGPDGEPVTDLPPAAWRAGWHYERPADAAPRLELHLRLNGPDFGYVVEFAPLECWGLALERAERAGHLRVQITWDPPHREPPVTVTFALEPDTLPTDGLRDFARDWRRQAILDDRLSIPKPPDAPV